MLSVIIPTYNERGNIANLIDEICAVLKRNKIAYEIVVVDDSSPDGTADVISEIKKKNRNVRLLSRKEKKGLGSAYKFAFPKARGDLILEMDADFSHNPKYLPELARALENADVVVGSRKVKGGKRKDSLGRQIFPAIGSFLFMVAGCPVRDPTSGFRGYKREIVDKIDLSKMPDDYSFQVAMIFEAKRNGAVITEIPIEFEARKSGETKYTNRDLFGNLWLLFKIFLRKR